EDVRRAISYERPGKVAILSFMGTVRENQTQEEFIEDYVLVGKLAAETGAKILEVNLSCPNIGNEGLVCYNLEVTRETCRRLRKVLGQTPLILKVGYYKGDAELAALAKVADEYAQAISSINTIQATVVDKEGNQALPGKARLRSGVCGASIKWAGLDMVRRLKSLRDKHKHTCRIVGVGGVMNAADFTEYREAGADAVMSATGAMWNPYLAQDIKASLHG
ncbi:MAG: diguanylate cyclase, partial [Patescibacteria group bacterium]